MNSKPNNTYVVMMLPIPYEMRWWCTYVSLGFDGFGIVENIDDATMFDDADPDETIGIVKEWSLKYHKGNREFTIKYVTSINTILDELSEL